MKEPMLSLVAAFGESLPLTPGSPDDMTAAKSLSLAKWTAFSKLYITCTIFWREFLSNKSPPRTLGDILNLSSVENKNYLVA